MSNITRIADLPSDNGPTGGANAYMPMNIHPNPYGLAPDAPVINPPQPEHSVAMSNKLSQEQQMALQNMPHRALPSRDIPQDTTVYAQDEQIQPNYIPRAASRNDYVRDQEEISERKHEEKKHRVRTFDYLLDEFQLTIFIAFLFFIFNMTAMDRLLISRFSFLSIYGEDGNLNFNGSLFKSTCFGITFYAITKLTNYLSDL